MVAAYYRSASAVWSGNATDAYFLAGGLLLGLLGYRYRPSRSEATRSSAMDLQVTAKPALVTGASR